VRKQIFILVLLICSPWLSAHAETKNKPQPTTLIQAINLAKEHPRLQISMLNQDAARASLSAQGSYAYNPELSLELQDRKLNGGGRDTDYYISLSQGIEMGGKVGYRKQVAQAELQQSQYDTQILRLQLIRDVATAFVQLHEADKVLTIRQQQSALYLELYQGVQRQLDVGDANLLQANLAASAYAAALSALNLAQQDVTLASNQYYQAIGQFDSHPINTDLPTLDIAWQTPNNAYDIALASRPEIKRLQAQTQHADAQADLANASRYVDPTISLMTGREAGEKLLKLGVSFPIPLSNNNKGMYQASLAQAQASQSQAAWFKQRLKQDVFAAISNHQSAMQVLKVFTQQTSADSTTLAKKAFDAGELSLEDLVLHINQALDAKLTRLNLTTQAWLTRIHLAYTLGHPEYILQGIQK